LSAAAPRRPRLFMGQPAVLLIEGAPMRVLFTIAAALAAFASPAQAQEFRLEEVPAIASSDPAQLKPRVILFSDHHKDEIADPGHGLIRFEDWARVLPAQKQFLSLYPSYSEPVVN